MTFYTLKDAPGCVIHAIRAEQYLGDPDPVRVTFGDVVTQAHRDVVLEQYPPALVITDQHGDRKMAMYGDFVFEHPENSGHLLVLSEVNFLDTYQQVPE
jgi:hypothetical protein